MSIYVDAINSKWFAIGTANDKIQDSVKIALPHDSRFKDMTEAQVQHIRNLYYKRLASGSPVISYANNTWSPESRITIQSIADEMVTNFVNVSIPLHALHDLAVSGKIDYSVLDPIEAEKGKKAQVQLVPTITQKAMISAGKTGSSIAKGAGAVLESQKSILGLVVVGGAIAGYIYYTSKKKNK